MESSHALYTNHHHHHHHHQPFNPPTFSRLPPDGDEFPNSWSDENSCGNGGGKSGLVVLAAPPSYADAKKVYRTEVTMIGTPSSQPPPPPLPESEPPGDETPPPLPSTVPPKPPLTRRSSSVEERKRLFAAANSAKFGPGVTATATGAAARAAQEPSKKSVKDKIAMFSSRSSSTEEEVVVVTPAAAAGAPKPAARTPTHLSTSTSSLPRTPASSSAFSRSSENLLGSPAPARHSVTAATNNSNILNNNTKGDKNAWKMSQSTYDLRGGRKNSVESTTAGGLPAAATNGTARPAITTASTTQLSERSQSMLDVGQELHQLPTSYQQRISSYRTSTTASPASKSETLSASILESRRKANLSKLRGLVIPDKTTVLPATVSSSVADLPTILSKDAVILPATPRTERSAARTPVTRTESLDSSPLNGNNNSGHRRILSSNDSSSNSAKPGAEGDLTDGGSGAWKLPPSVPALPKYSPAFKRRGLMPYQSPLTSATGVGYNKGPAPNGAAAFNTLPTNYKLSTPEPKSLESLTSPHSDSSFEFTAVPNNNNNNNNISSSPVEEHGAPAPPVVVAMRKSSVPKSPPTPAKDESNVPTGPAPPPPAAAEAPAPRKGKLEDSDDNDSAVSSSRSSISHGLSPRNSPTPEESTTTTTTPDPDGACAENGRKIRAGEEEEEEDSNSDEGWRVLKPQSVEAINRKNVLASAKFSSGLVVRTSEESAGAKGGNSRRRSEDDEAGYADAEAEDTESSCSELDISSSTRLRRSSVTNRLAQAHHHHHHHHHHHQTRHQRPKVDTEEEEEDDLIRVTHHSAQSSLDLADLGQTLDLTQSPLQAIFDMEVQMAYINEICDALPTRGAESNNSPGLNRYFSRRDSEATVIERPIANSSSSSSRRNSREDQIDSAVSGAAAAAAAAAAERRSRNRSSSGNESDFSSSISVGSQGQIMTQAMTSTTKVMTDEEKWSVLEKKYSKSLTAVNLVGSTLKEPAPAAPSKFHTATTAAAPSAADGIEKTMSRMMEKTSTSSSHESKAKLMGALPKGRNDFKSLSEKWQQLSAEGTTTPGGATTTATTPAGTATTIKTPKPPLLEKPGGLTSYRKLETQQEFRSSTTTTITKSAVVVAEVTKLAAASAEDSLILAGDSWSTTTSTPGKRLTPDDDVSPEIHLPPLAMSTTKRSVSVNDIRKAFEKAESQVNSYGREDNSAPDLKSPGGGGGGNGNKDSNGLSLPSAHFRVSSFDSTTSEESSATTPAGLYGSVNSLVSSAPRDPYGSITSLASSTSLISPQELQQLIDEANQSLEEAGTPSHEVCVIILHREYAGGSLGITLAGGADYETKEITVHKVLTGSIADRDGRIHRGDRVLSINGKSTKGLTHREALNLLKAPRTEVVLVVSRGRSGSNGFQTIEETTTSTATLERAVEPLLLNGSISSLLENDEEGSFKWGPIRTVMLVKDGAGLGFSLEGGKGSIHGDKPLTVKKIFVGGPAEKCGELKVGDLIVSINGINMSSKSRTEAWNFMKKLGDGEVKISVRSPAS